MLPGFITYILYFLGYRLTSDYINLNHSASSLVECGIFCLQEKCSGFNYKARKKKNEINCELTNLQQASLHVITNDELWDFYEVEYDNFFNKARFPAVITL